MRARQYAKEIVASKTDTERASAFLTLFLRDGYDIDKRFGMRMETLMHKAARDHNLELAKLLRKNGAYIRIKNLFGNTPYEIANGDAFGSIRFPQMVKFFEEEIQYSNYKNAIRNSDLIPDG